LSEWLADVLHWTGKQPRPVAVAAAVASAAGLPPALRAAGCFDIEVKTPALGLQGRAALLLSGFQAKGLAGFEGGLQALEGLAGQGLEGFDAKDLQLVVDRAVHEALRRQMSGAATTPGTASSELCTAHAQPAANGTQQQQQQQQQPGLLVTAADVSAALAGFVPAAFWRAGQKGGRQQQAAEGGLHGWQDVGEFAGTAACIVACLLPAVLSGFAAACCQAAG
jgi:hypothetical protein